MCWKLMKIHGFWYERSDEEKQENGWETWDKFVVYICEEQEAIGILPSPPQARPSPSVKDGDFVWGCCHRLLSYFDL